LDPAPAPVENGDRQPIPSPSAAAAVSAPRSGLSTVRFIVWRIVPFIPALIPAAIVIAITIVLVQASHFHNFGNAFWSTSGQYGMGVFILGSFLTAVPALFFSMAIGLGIAIASTTYLPQVLARVLDTFVDLLAGIPSVIYGIWGFWVVAPVFGHTINPWLAMHFSFIPGFAPHSTFPVSPSPAGVGLPLAIFILTLMALPITTLLIRDALRAIPKDLVESGLALGATRWEVVRRVSLKQGSRGIISAAFLGFGRAIGETVAVAMVIGASDRIPVNFYDATWTMAAYILDSLDAAEIDPTFLAALAELALVLMLITFLVNLAGRRLVTSLYAQEVPGI
jgi:phosphate transport system permease protein